MDEPVPSRPVAELTSAEVADAVTRSFEGYLVSIRFTPEAYERRFRNEHLDPYASRVYVRDGVLIGVMLVARRGWTRRVAAMGFVPEARGQGLGRRALSEVITEARSLGERTVMLEVIDGNAPAMALYTKVGFRPLRRLVGYRWQASPGPEPDALTEIDPLEVSRAVCREGEKNLPWMLSAETLAGAVPPSRAYCLKDRLEDRAFALTGDPKAENLSLTALVVPRAHRRQGWGSRMLNALAALHPGRPWLISPVVPEDLAPGFFARPGWGRNAISQWEMRLEI
jgi:ribosomal protein S18 acetylase RimI-like enzyme